MVLNIHPFDKNVKLVVKRKASVEDVSEKKKNRKTEFEHIREFSAIATLYFKTLTSYCCANVVHFSQRIYYLF